MQTALRCLYLRVSDIPEITSSSNPSVSILTRFGSEHFFSRVKLSPVMTGTVVRFWPVLGLKLAPTIRLVVPFPLSSKNVIEPISSLKAPSMSLTLFIPWNACFRN